MADDFRKVIRSCLNLLKDKLEICCDEIVIIKTRISRRHSVFISKHRGSYYHETKRILLNDYDAEVDFILTPSVISVAFLQTVGIENLDSCGYILPI